MKMKHFLLVFLIGILAIGLSGCRLPASTAPEPTATVEEGGFPIPGAGTETMGLFETIATQTAMAQGGGVPVQEATPEPPAVEAPAEPAEEQPAEPPAEQPAEAPAPQEQAAEPQPEAPRGGGIPEPTQGVPESYTVQKGEFPYCLARRFNVNPNDLLSANGLGVNSQLQPGQVLRIPQSAGGFPGTRALHPHPTDYTVRAGDTIFSIACYFGDVDPYRIAWANELSEPFTISAGQTLYIP
jgi:nucleoid-associated protein YgaU